jgi:hypothetical protein
MQRDKPMRLLGIIFIASIALAGCVHPVVEKYDPKTYKEGIITHQPVPFMQVSEDGIMSIIYLPDPEDMYVITVSGLFGDYNSSPVLANGWNLTGNSTSTGSEATMKDMLTAAASGAKGAMAIAPMRTSLRAGLYRIDLLHNKLIGPLAIQEK